MGNCYLTYYIARDHIHTEITCNTEVQQKYSKPVACLNGVTSDCFHF